MQDHAGFTLVELIITLAVAAIVLAVAVPAFSNFLTGQRVTTQANDFLVSITYARSEALKRGLPISVCASDDGASCSGTNDWDDGWIVFVDDSAAAPDGDVDAGEDVLRIHGALESSSLAADGGATWVAFDDRGVATQRDDFTLAPGTCGSVKARSIDLEPTGRADTTRVACP